MSIVRIVCLAMLVLLICVGGLRGTAAGGEELMALTGSVWVTNRTLNNVAVFDAATGVLRGVAAVGEAPIGIVAPPGTGKVYVSNESSNTVSVLSAANLALLKTVVMGPRPHHMVHDLSGRFVFVAEYGSNQVGVIDTRTDQRVKALVASASAAARTHAAWPAADGKVYAVSEVSNELAAIDGNTGQILWTLPVGNRPSEVVVTSDARTAYVSVRNDNKLKVINLGSRAIASETTVGIQPDTLTLMGDGRTLIIGLRGIPAQAAFVDLSTLNVAWVDVGGTTTGHQWFSEESRFTFIAVEGPGDLGSVGVIDNNRRKLVTSYPYPKGGKPHGVYYQSRR